MKNDWIAALSLTLALGMTGCAGRDKATASASLDGTAWVLASLPGRTLVPDTTPTAHFEAGRVAGSDGCNRYSMPFKEKGATLEIGPIGPSTHMMCEASVGAQAEAFTSALLKARSYRRGSGILELRDAGGGVVVTLKAQEQSLANTAWNVTMINNGRQAVVSIVNGSTVTMVFDASGRVSGSTGCNQYTATYRAQGGALGFSQVAATRRACADPAVDEQEQAFLRALESVASLRFEGNRLELRAADGALALLLDRKR